jgi:hypothetical protein
MWEHGLDRAGSELGQVTDTCEYGDEPPDSVKRSEFRD